MAFKLWSDSFSDGAPIPGEFAFCVIDAKTHVAMSANRNPHLAWSGVPAGTQSFALICHDYDVPSRGDDVNQEGRLVPPELPRVDFFHWVLIDIPAGISSIAAGSHSNGVTPRGKPGPDVKNIAPGGMRHGINDYTGWFANDNDMAGDYYGYDGPCPPWNDSLVHHYVFSLFALDIARLPLQGKFTGAQARQAMQGHVLSHNELMGTYTLNPALV
jgi:Raf kinase inhibitor-like YbhB/YbcL family protein